jgi:hypothetical protein
MNYESLLVILASGGTALEPDALRTLVDAEIVWVRIEREGESACLAARVRHRDRPDRFRARVRSWADPRRWAVTVAPCAPTL